MKKKILLVAFFMITILAIMQNATFATSDYYTETTGKSSNNVSDNNYTKWASCINSYLIENDDGTITRVEEINSNELYIEIYNSSFELQSSKTISGELTKIGAVYGGEDYNYVIYGQDNTDESNSVEVMRVVKYSKSWTRISSVSLYGENTYQMFASGSCRVTETNGILIIDTSHTMYTSSDGYNHQANFLVKIAESTMTVSYCRSAVSYITTDGYVSHSFNQFIVTDGSYLYEVNHGDAYPRSVSLTKTAISSKKPTAYVNAFSILGEIGANSTGVSVGGVELSTNNVLIVRKFCASRW